jgi:hypothetical protein
MNTQQTDLNASQVNIEQRMRTVRTLWVGLLASIGMYYVFTLIAGRPENLASNNTLSMALLIGGVSTTLVSFVVKNKLIRRAIDERQVLHVQPGYLVAWVITEFAALLGLVDFFATNNPYFYVLFIIAALADLFHFPRREHFENASFRGSPELLI